VTHRALGLWCTGHVMDPATTLPEDAAQWTRLLNAAQENLS